ncbi:MAG: hypothetical protein ACI8PZ_000177 [Myxococcota bacterium]|jgi:hypothetical protein
MLSLHAVLLTASLAADLRVGAFEVDEPWGAVEDRHAAAVDVALRRVPILFRALVRPRLTSAVWSCDGWATEVDARQVSLQCRGRAPLVVPTDGSPVDLQLEDGRTVEFRALATANTLELNAVGRHGAQHSLWRVDGNDHLVVERTIQSRWLPDDVTWAVRYRRVPTATP